MQPIISLMALQWLLRSTHLRVLVRLQLLLYFSTRYLMRLVIMLYSFNLDSPNGMLCYHNLALPWEHSWVPLLVLLLKSIAEEIIRRGKKDLILVMLVMVYGVPVFI